MGLKRYNEEKAIIEDFVKKADRPNDVSRRGRLIQRVLHPAA